MSALDHLERPTIAIAYLQLLVEILAERGIGRDALLARLPVPASLLDQADAKMSAAQWTRLVLRARELTADPSLGYVYGLRMRPTAHGLVGYAAMSCATMRDSIEVSVRYLRARQAHFDAELRREPDAWRFVLRERVPIPVLRTFFYENILLGLARGFAALLGRELASFRELSIHFDTPEPAHHADFRDRLPPVRFDEPWCGVRVPLACLELRPALADPQASKQALALCERELALAADPDDVIDRVRATLTGVDGGYPQVAEVAARLSTSSRTLKRKLRHQGSSFAVLLEEARRRDAHALLVGTSLSVREIAERLGYVNPANFSRAFRLWTGEPPTRYRERRASAG